MEKITIGQFLAFTNRYVSVYIEDEFQRYNCIHETATGLLKGTMNNLLENSELKPLLTESQLECPIDYIRNVDGGHFGDDEKTKTSIVLGIGIENWEKYFGKE